MVIRFDNIDNSIYYTRNTTFYHSEVRYKYKETRDKLCVMQNQS